MSKLFTEEERDEKFTLMRAKQERMLAHPRPHQRPPSFDTLAREERQKKNGIPAHLEMYRINEVAQMLGVSRRSVIRWFRDVAVKPPGTQRKGTLLISRAVLEDWIREHTAA